MKPIYKGISVLNSKSLPELFCATSWWDRERSVFELSCFGKRGSTVIYTKKIPSYYNRVRESVNIPSVADYLNYLKSFPNLLIEHELTFIGKELVTDVKKTWTQKYNYSFIGKVFFKIKYGIKLTHARLKRAHLRREYKRKNADYYVLTPENYHTLEFFSYTHESENPLIIDGRAQIIDAFVDYIDLAMAARNPKQIVSEFGNYLYNNYFGKVLIGQVFTNIPRLDEIKQVLAIISSFRTAEVLNRPYLATLIARHDRLHEYTGVREQIVKEFYKAFPECKEEILFPSNLLHNTEILKEKYGDVKQAFLRDCIFNICPENTYAKGYITEKLLEAVLSGCIPVYWGGGDEEITNIFNPKAILIYNPRKPGELAQRLQSLINDPQTQEEFFSEELFLPYTAEYLFLDYVYPIVKYFWENNLMEVGEEFISNEEVKSIYMDRMAPPLSEFVQTIPIRRKLDAGFNEDFHRAMNILATKYPDVKLQNKNFYLENNRWPFLEKDKRALEHYQKLHLELDSQM